jgi:hypothetical protein
MSDAGEVLLAIYERIRSVGPAAGAALDAVFGLSVTESVTCARCGLTTHATSFTEYLHNAQAAALRLVAEPGSSLGAVLREIEAQAPKTCDTDAGGCGHRNRVNRFLQAPPPRVFTLQLSWGTHAEDPEDIGAALRAVQERLQLSDLYQAVDPGTAPYRLRAVAAYYGRHYQALVLLPVGGGADGGGRCWTMLDDARASAVGGWEEVVRKCQAGRIQPSVLFYEAEDEGEGVDVGRKI